MPISYRHTLLLIKVFAHKEMKNSKKFKESWWILEREEKYLFFLELSKVKTLLVSAKIIQS